SDLLLPLGLLGLAPGALGNEVGAQAGDRLALPGRLDLGIVAVAAGVVGGGVVGQAVGDQFQHAAAVAIAGAGDGMVHGGAHGDDVVAVHLHAVEAAGQALLGQGLGAGLRVARHRDGPLVVDDAQHEGQGVGAGRVDGGVGVGLGAAAVADAGDRHARFAAQLEGQGGAGRVQALGGDGHAPGVVVRRAGEVVAALVAAPVHQHVARLHAAHELGAVLAVARREHVVVLHRAADADVGGLVAQAAGVGARSEE